MSRPNRLLRTGYATVAADGTATITHQTGNFDWVVTLYAIGQNPKQSGTEPFCTFYRNQPSGEMQLDFTRAGNGDSATHERLLFTPGESAIASWTGATPGSRVSFRIEGLELPPGMGIVWLANAVQ